MRSRRVIVVATVLALVAYFVALHALIVNGTMPALALTWVVTPWLVAAAAGLSTVASVRMRVIVAVSSIAIVAAIAWHFGALLGGRVDLLLYLENVVFLASLSSMFAFSLRRDAEPFVTRLARTARRGDMPPAVVRYTRLVTIAWACLFAVLASIATVLFFTQSRTAWSSFVNLTIGPLVALAFALEYAIRLRVLPNVAHGSMMASVRAFRQRDTSGEPR